jgi:formylglycine-generating enzyme required for sulfatase activity
MNIAPTDVSLACHTGYATWTSQAGSQETLPITCVNWYEAYAFCTWDGGFLPSEAESEFASAGGSEQRQYPWGSDAPGLANQYAIFNCYFPSGSGTCTTVGNIAPVGFTTLGLGRWGQADLAGDMWEWMMDRYAPYVDPCTDCVDLTSATSYRTIRGDVFNYAATYLPSAQRAFTPSTRLPIFGMRCARTP